MSYNIDIVIIVSFLVINLLFGLYSSRGVTTVKEYAIGNRNFSTATIAATIVATWIFGSVISLNLLETYNNGLYFVLPALSDGLSFFIIAYFYAPRMKDFLGNLSVAEAMGSIYGKQVRGITAISAVIPAIGNVAAQFSILAILFIYLFDTLGGYTLVITGFIVIIYTTFGGIKSVTFTDVIQFFTFGIIIPMMIFLMWKGLDSNDELWTVLKFNSLFDFKEVLDVNNPRFLSTLLLFLFFMLPGIDPALFQRISMAKNTIQVKRSFIIAGIIITCFYMLVQFGGVLLLADKVTNIDQNNIFKYILDTYFNNGFKCILIIGITAMIMSTIDSYINVAAVLLAYDSMKSIGIELTERKQLVLVRIAALFIGIAGLLLSLFANNILNLILSTYSFYMPIVSVPLILAIFGFRSSSRAVLIGMLAGFITVIFFKLFSEIDSVIPGIIANTVFFIGSHYILREQGGWIGIKENSPLNAIRLERKRKINRFIHSVKTFNIFKLCQSNSPKKEGGFVYFGLFSIIIVFSNAFSLPRIFYQEYNFLNIIFYPQLIISVIFITYPLLQEKLKEQKIVQNIISLIWVSGVFYLIFISNLFLILNNFALIQFIILMASLIIVAILLKWQGTLFFLVIGMICSNQFYKFFLNLKNIQENTDLEFKVIVIYSSLLFTSILIAFFKPKQEMQELNEQRADHLSEQVHDIDEELKKSVEVKNEFLRNLQHEAHTPIVGITTMGQVLFENYDKLTEEQKRKGLQEIAKNSERLSTLVNNMIDVSKLSSLNYVLNKKMINLSELIYERLDYCKKLYLGDKDLEFICDIENNISINFDAHYITSTLDNLIVNAISYSSDGKIIIEFKKNNDFVKFKITDEGIGIPKKELYSIFGTFIVSSRTKTPAGGRGLGLALCKGVIEAHKGQIWCKSDGKKGSSFAFTLPINS